MQILRNWLEAMSIYVSLMLMVQRWYLQIQGPNGKFFCTEFGCHLGVTYDYMKPHSWNQGVHQQAVQFIVHNHASLHRLAYVSHRTLPTLRGINFQMQDWNPKYMAQYR